MTTLRLQRNVQFLYEEHLARIELRALGCDDPDRDENDPWRLTAHVNGTTELIRRRAAYIGAVAGQPTVYADLITPSYQGGRFNRTRSVNQYLTHWIYPYRGKFHPQMVRALLNILGVAEGARVLDPFMGSGTTGLESLLLGAECLGVDRSPVCILVAKVKTQSYLAAPAISARVDSLLSEDEIGPEDIDPDSEENPLVADFLRVAQLVTASDVSRRSREAGSAFRRNLRDMRESVDALATAIGEMGIRPGTVTVTQGDARQLGEAGVEADSVDAVVTSPPYSLALDYVKNDEHALATLGVNMPRMREEMIGVRGRGAAGKMAAYNQDMQQSLAELARVLKPGAGAAYVVGDATVGGGEVTTTTEMVDWAAAVGLRLDRSISKIVFGLYNVMQDEKILVFRKE